MAHKQGYKDRMDESKSMKGKTYGGSFSLKDNTQASGVKPIATNSEQYDMGRLRYESVGSKGYPAQAWDYDY